MFTSLGRHNPNSSFQLCFLHVRPSWSLSGYCHQQGQAVSADTLMAFLFRFDIPLLVERVNLWPGLTDSPYLWKLSKPKQEWRKKILKETTFLGFVPSESILGGFFCFLCKINKILTKLTRRTKCFTFLFFFFFEEDKGGNRKKIPFFFIKQQKYPPKEKDIQHCVWKIYKNIKGVTRLVILSQLYTNTYKTWMNTRGNIF